MNADVIVTLNGLAGIKSPSALVCAAFMFTSTILAIRYLQEFSQALQSK